MAIVTYTYMNPPASMIAGSSELIAKSRSTENKGRPIAYTTNSGRRYNIIIAGGCGDRSPFGMHQDIFAMTGPSDTYIALALESIERLPFDSLAWQADCMSDAAMTAFASLAPICLVGQSSQRRYTVLRVSFGAVANASAEELDAMVKAFLEESRVSIDHPVLTEITFTINLLELR